MDWLTKMTYEWHKKIWEEDKSFFWDVAIVYGAILSFLLVELYHMQDVIPILLTVYTTKALRWVETLT